MNLETRRDDRATAARPDSAAEATPRVAPDDLDRPVEQKPMAQREPVTEKATAAEREDEALAPLFTPEVARDFRASWDAVQISFVDDPKQAVRKADELVRQVLEDLGQTFSAERAAFDERADDSAQASTEKLRMALRRYRSFLQRLLSL